MKLLLIVLTVLPLLANAAANPPKPAPLPKWGWAVKPSVLGTAILTVEDAKEIYSTTKQKVTSLSDQDVVLDMMQNLGDGIVALSEMTDEQVALEIVNAIFTLSEMGEHVRRYLPDAGAAANVVVFPAVSERLKTARALGDFDGFKEMVLEGMKVAQEAQRRGPQDDRKWYFLGAVGNMRVTTRGFNDAHLQLVLGLKPQTIEQGENKIVIPETASSADAPIAIVDISLPMEFTIPKIEISFGKIGELQSVSERKINYGRGSRIESEWRLRFEPSANGSLSSCKSYPRVLKTMTKMGQSFYVGVPIFAAKIDGNEQRMTDANVGVSSIAKIPVGCTSVFGFVNPEFVKTVNQSITDSTFSDILGLSLRELAERVQRLKEVSRAAP